MLPEPLRLLLLLLLLLLGAAAAPPGPFYVSPSGDDGADGLSPATAFRTPARAQLAARAVARPLAADLSVRPTAGD